MVMNVYKTWIIVHVMVLSSGPSCIFNTERFRDVAATFFCAAPLNFLRLNPPTCVSYGAPSDEDLRWGTSGAHMKHMHIRLTFVTELCLFFFCLLVQPDGLLFCLKRDKPRCFPSSTLSTAGFPGLGDLSLHSCTCFLCFVSLPCSLVCLSHYISLFLCPHLFFLSVFSFPVSLWQPARQSFPLFCNLSDRWY